MLRYPLKGSYSSSGIKNQRKTNIKKRNKVIPLLILPVYHGFSGCKRVILVGGGSFLDNSSRVYNIGTKKQQRNCTRSLLSQEVVTRRVGGRIVRPVDAIPVDKMGVHWDHGTCVRNSHTLLLPSEELRLQHLAGEGTTTKINKIFIPMYIIAELPRKQEKQKTTK
jgi:hypothetical protein